MKSIRHLVSFAVILTITFAAPLATPTTAGPPEKGNVCHAGDSGWEIVNIAEPAFDAHIEHGDAFPGDPVPGQPNHTFDSSCTPVDTEPGARFALLNGLLGCSNQFPGWWGVNFHVNAGPYEPSLGWRIVEAGFERFEPTPYEFIPVSHARTTGFPADPRDGLGMLPVGGGGSFTMQGGTVEFSDGETVTFDSVTVNDPGPGTCGTTP